MCHVCYTFKMYLLGCEHLQTFTFHSSGFLLFLCWENECFQTERKGERERKKGRETIPQCRSEMIQDQDINSEHRDIMSRYWLTWAVGGEKGGAEKKMGREIKSAAYGGETEKWRDQEGKSGVCDCVCGQKKNAVLKRETESERRGEIWHFGKGGERNCSYQGLAAFQAVWLWFWRPPVFFSFCLTSRLTDWTQGLPSPCLITTFTTSVPMAPPSVYSWLKKGRIASHMCHLSFLTHLTGQKESLWIGIWNDKQTNCKSPLVWARARIGCTFFPDQHQSSFGKLQVENWHIFCPSGRGERLETFLVGQ